MLLDADRIVSFHVLPEIRKTLTQMTQNDCFQFVRIGMIIRLQMQLDHVSLFAVYYYNLPIRS